MSNEHCLSFLVDWMDPQSSILHEYRLRYFTSSFEVDMINLKSKKVIPELHVSCMYIGSRMSILSRNLTVRGFGDDATEEFVKGKNVETTCAIIKPNAYNNIGDIISIIQDTPGMRISKLKMFHLSKDLAEEFYAEHSTKPFFQRLTDFISSDAIVAIELTGVGVIKEWRSLIGPTDSATARSVAPNSIRARFGVDGTRNAVHGSDSQSSADREIHFFFQRLSKSSTAIGNNCSLCVVKPHVFDIAAGQIVQQIMDANLEISAMELTHVYLVEELLEIYRGIVPDFAALCAELASSAALVMEVRGVNVIEQLRALVGPGDPELARQVRPQSMRAKFGVDWARNAVHCTDLLEDETIAPKVHIPLARIQRLFSRGSGNGGQNLHASHSRCLLKFNVNTADWLPLRVRESFIQSNGQFISAKGTVVIVREDTRSPSDNEKLALRQLQEMLDKAADLAEEQDARGTEPEHATEQERIKATKTQAQLQRYKNALRREKQFRSETKRNRKSFFDQ